MSDKMQIGSFLIRVTLGLIFFVHGLMKFQGGVANTGKFFESVGIPAPGVMAMIVAAAELAGGIFLLIGLGTRIISAIFAVIMLVAIFAVKLSSGFAGGYEFELALLIMAVHLLLSGSRLLAADRVFVRDSSKTGRPTDA